uniref:RING-type E3 ubiquitin transferase n=1 Tax=Myxobolus squamalis TaxID=59785 RepID=A0A6B2G6X7_MYXSQ
MGNLCTCCKTFELFGEVTPQQSASQEEDETHPRNHTYTFLSSRNHHDTEYLIQVDGEKPIVFKTEKEFYEYKHRMEISENLPSWLCPENKKDDKSECPICISFFEPGQKIKALPCAHHFHVSCINLWLKTSLICPICSQNIKDSISKSDKLI